MHRNARPVGTPHVESAFLGELKLKEAEPMDTTTLLIVIIVLLLLFGGGWYGRGRWY